MKLLLIVFCTLISFGKVFGQQDTIVIPESDILNLNTLIEEVQMNNQEIQAMQHEWDMLEAKVPQASSLDDPTLEYMHDEFPDFNIAEPMKYRLRLMQMFPFPGKLSSKEAIADIQAEHAHHDHLETINEIIASLKSAYYELWFTQQSIFLMQENVRLMRQFSEIALAKYSVGSANQQDVLKAEVEIAKMNNEIIDLRAKEIAAKAMLLSLLNRSAQDTLGFAVISEAVAFPYKLDTLEQLALANRQMLKHDSLGIVENETMLKLSKQEYLPDFTFGLERISSPMTEFNGWTISAGITLPFAPWVLGKADSRVQEADLGIKKATATYNASKNMVLAGVRELYAKIKGEQQQLESYAKIIIPTARQSLNVSLSLYQNGKTDFLMLIDAFRTLTDLRMEYFMRRMQFEQAIAGLEQTVGMQITTTQE
ncbi:MAG: TolC family protein [Bacteroidetes bacterium]|nr:MAG: TolC family protein [Bacteroidota bacterium]